MQICQQLAGRFSLLKNERIKEEAPKSLALPHPEHTGLRHLAFRVTDVEETLAEFDRLEIPHTELRYDDFDGRKMAFFFDPDGLPLEIHE